MVSSYQVEVNIVCVLCIFVVNNYNKKCEVENEIEYQWCSVLSHITHLDITISNKCNTQ